MSGIREKLRRLPAFTRWAMAAAGAMIVATVVSNIANYAYGIVMAHMLGTARFGEFTALLGVLMFAAIATQLVQTVVSRYTTTIQAEHGPEAVAAFAHRMGRVFLMVGIAAFAISIPLAWPLASVLRLDVTSAIAATSALLLGFVMPVAWGRYQGEQQFWRLGMNMIVLNVARFVAGVAAVIAGAGVAGAVGANTVSTVVVLLMCWSALRAPRTDGVYAGPPISELARFAFPTFIGLIAWTSLTNLDVVMVKALASDEQAGQYGAAATVGKIALFLPMALGLVILPKGAARHEAGVDSRGVLRRTGQALMAVSAVFVGVCFLFGEQIIGLMFKPEFAPASRLLTPLVLAMCCFALANVMLFYYLAVRRMRFTYVLLVLMAAQIVLLAVFAGNPRHAALVQTGLGVVLLIINEMGFVPLLRRLRAPTEPDASPHP